MSPRCHFANNPKDTDTNMTYLGPQIISSLVGGYKKENRCTCSVLNAIVGSVLWPIQTVVWLIETRRGECLRGSLLTGQKTAFSNELEICGFKNVILSVS